MAQAGARRAGAVSYTHLDVYKRQELDNNTPADVQKMTELINTILHIIRLHFKIVFHEDSFSYQRFITHLKFFSARIFSHEPYKDSMKEIYDVLIEQNTYVFSGVQKVAEFIQKKYDYTLSIDESLYLPVSYTHLDVYKRQHLYWLHL